MVPRLRRLPKPKFLYRLPIRRVRRSDLLVDVSTQPGLSGQLASLLERAEGDGWSPRYDFAYVDWQIGRSPLTRCWTSYAPVEGESRAAAVYWRAAASRDSWRLAVWYEAEYLGPLRRVVQEAVAEIDSQGGMKVSAIVSRHDRGLQQVLRSVGFLPFGPRRPLYVCAGSGGDAPPELRGLSFLDTRPA